MKTIIGLNSIYMLMMQVDKKEQNWFIFTPLSADNHKAWCFFSHCCEVLRGQHSIAWSYWVVQQWLPSGLTWIFGKKTILIFPTPLLPQMEITAMLSTWGTPSNHLQFLDGVEHSSPLL